MMLRNVRIMNRKMIDFEKKKENKEIIIVKENSKEELGVEKRKIENIKREMKRKIKEKKNMEDIGIEV